ncbi:unnamed protein product [Lampetra fluviatilis]
MSAGCPSAASDVFPTPVAAVWTKSPQRSLPTSLRRLAVDASKNSEKPVSSLCPRRARARGASNPSTPPLVCGAEKSRSDDVRGDVAGGKTDDVRGDVGGMVTPGRALGWQGVMVFKEGYGVQWKKKSRLTPPRASASRESPARLLARVGPRGNGCKSTSPRLGESRVLNRGAPFASERAAAALLQAADGALRRGA